MSSLKLTSPETELIGAWVTEDGRVRGDAVCERIYWLASHHLRTAASDRSGWETLFQDPDDGRYWERTFPHGEMHGGGPPALRHLSREQAKAKYGNGIA